jgi:hypothetical protein
MATTAKNRSITAHVPVQLAQKVDLELKWTSKALLNLSFIGTFSKLKPLIFPEKAG